jgi:hypothetical protein
MFNVLAKIFRLIPLASNLVLALGIEGFVEKGAALIVGQPGLETARVLFFFFLSFFFCFP